MEQILLAYGLPKEIVTAIMMLYKNMKAIVHSPDGGKDFFDIVAGPFVRIYIVTYMVQKYDHWYEYAKRT